MSRAHLVRANNPSPMTLDGTNTWVLRASDHSRAIVVDPGPDDPQHLQAVLEASGPAGVGLIVLTHGHADHAEAAVSFAEMAKAPVRAIEPQLCKDAEPLRHLEILDVDGVRVQVITTPGHTADSACFIVSEDRAVLTGDTILGLGSTVVAHPDGRLLTTSIRCGCCGRLSKNASSSPSCLGTDRHAKTRPRSSTNTSRIVKNASTKCGRRSQTAPARPTMS